MPDNGIRSGYRLNRRVAFRVRLPEPYTAEQLLGTMHSVNSEIRIECLAILGNFVLGISSSRITEEIVDKILVIDDEHEIAALTSQFLIATGYEVRSLTDPRKFDVVFRDLASTIPDF
jgi:PleD family two-component response regulator